MKQLRSLVVTVLIVLCLTTSVFAKEFSGTFSLTGAAPIRLIDWLVANGYAGSDAVPALDFLTLCNPSSNTNDLYFGQSNVNASNGFNLTPGQCNTWPPGNRPTDSFSIYLLVASTQNTKVILRTR